MPTMAQISKLALELPEKDRWRLLGKLAASLTPKEEDDDDGIAEAMRRQKEWEAHPEMLISIEQHEELMARRRKSK